MRSSSVDGVDRCSLDVNDEDGLSRKYSFNTNDSVKNVLSSQSFLSGQYTTIATFGVGLASVVAEIILAHPCIVFRRQCQIRHDSIRYHLTPFTLLPEIYRIQQHQGIYCLWKGLGSTFVFRGLRFVTESVISDITWLPKEVNRHSSVKKMAQHLFLKCIASCLLTPFYASSVVETVQAEVVSERFGVFDCMKDGVTRAISMIRLIGIGAPTTSSRLLGLHQLILPTMLLSVCSYSLRSLAEYAALTTLRKDEEDDVDEQLLANDSSAEDHDPAATVQKLYRRFYPELLASFAGGLLSDIVLYPLETLVHRLCVQGTRTIVDDLDTGTTVAPATAAYLGTVDAVRSIWSQEGISGFYKGFGALILQYMIHVALLKAARGSFEFILRTYAPPPMQPRAPHLNDAIRDKSHIDAYR